MEMNPGSRERLFAVWRRTLRLSWPVSVQQVFSTLMRTTDIIITGLFSPAAVAAIGLADLYAQVPGRMGQGFGGGAIALSSQDTGSGAAANRDEAVTQAILMAFVTGIPFAAFGILFGQEAIALLGASPEVSRLGGTYLAIVFAATPARMVSIVGVSSLQGTGDTRTPMTINIAANVINIVGSVTFGLGLGPAPRLTIFGVGLATAIANVFNAVVILAAIRSDRTVPAFARPRNPTITRQLVVIGAPRFGEGMSGTVAAFPFNALLLTFGTEVVAAYHIGRRMYQQFMAPFYRAFNTAASIIVGQSLGRVGPDEARFNGWAVGTLAFAILAVIGAGMVAGADYLVLIFTNDPPTVRYAVAFARTFGIGSIFLGLFFVFGGALRGAGETVTPFIGRLTGTFVFMLGFSYLAGVILDYGVVGVYAGIVLAYLWMVLLVIAGFARGNWATRATTMMAARESL